MLACRRGLQHPSDRMAVFRIERENVKKTTTQTVFLLLAFCAALGASSCARSEADLEKAASVELAPEGDTSGMLRISWRLQSQENVYGFNVYRSLSEEGPWERANDSIVPGHDTTSIPQVYAFHDMGLRLGQTYHYYVEEVTFSGTTDKITPILSSTAKLPQYYIDKGYEVPEISPGAPN